MYKVKDWKNLDIISLTLCSELQWWVDSSGYSPSYNKFEISGSDSKPNINWITNLNEEQRNDTLVESLVKNIIYDSYTYSSSFDTDGLTFTTSSFSSQSLYYLDNDLIDETTKCIGYASTGSLNGFNSEDLFTSKTLLKNLKKNSQFIQEIDVEINNNELNCDVYINSSSFDTTLVESFCSQSSLDIGLVGFVDVTNKKTFSSKFNHHIKMYGKSLTDDSVQVYGTSNTFVSNYGNQLARKLAINEVKELGIGECYVEIQFIEGEQVPSYIKIKTNDNQYFRDTSLFTKNYILNTYGLSNNSAQILKESYFS